jgi:hypothetical protein
MGRRAGQAFAFKYAAPLELGYSPAIQPVNVWQAVPILSDEPGGAATRMARTLLWRRQARRQARLDARTTPCPEAQAQTIDRLLARRDAKVSSVAIHADAVYAAIKSYVASFRPDPIVVVARRADAAALASAHLDLAAARLRELHNSTASGPDAARAQRARQDIVRDTQACLCGQMDSVLDAVARARRLHHFYRDQMREAATHCASAGQTARAIQNTLDRSAHARLDAYRTAFLAERTRQDGEPGGAGPFDPPIRLVDRLPAPEPAARLVRDALAQIERNLAALTTLQAWAQARRDRLGSPRSTKKASAVEALDADRLIAAWRTDFATPLSRRANPLPALFRR